jgi:hypothetical protein
MWRIRWAPNSIPIISYIQQDATLHSLYLETALHVSGGTFTHHQEGIQLYLQHLVFVTPLLPSAAIVEELEPVWVCCGWRTPPTAHSNRFEETPWNAPRFLIYQYICCFIVYVFVLIHQASSRWNADSGSSRQLNIDSRNHLHSRIPLLYYGSKTPDRLTNTIAIVHNRNVTPVPQRGMCLLIFHIEKPRDVRYLWT